MLWNMGELGALRGLLGQLADAAFYSLRACRIPLVGLGADISRHTFCKNTRPKLSDFRGQFPSDTKSSPFQVVYTHTLPVRQARRAIHPSMGWGWWWLGSKIPAPASVPGSSCRRHGTLSCWSMSVVLQVFFDLRTFRESWHCGGAFLDFFLHVPFLPAGGRGEIESVGSEKNKVRRVETQFPLLDWMFTSHDTPASPRNLTLQESASPTTTHHHDLTVIPGLIPQVEHMGMPTNPLQLAPPHPRVQPRRHSGGGGSVPVSRMPCGG